jgi:hypothetical protein
MSASTDLIDRALALPAEQRADLARKLLLSLEGTMLDDPAEAERLCGQEIEARLDRTDAGGAGEADRRVAVKRVRKNLGIAEQ